MSDVNGKSTLLTYVSWFLPSFFAFYQFFLQTVASVMNNDWMQSFHLDQIGVSNLSAAFFYAYVIMQIPVGILYDRYKPKPILVYAAVLLSLSCLLMGITHTYHIALLARFVMGMASAFGFIGLLKITADWFPAKNFALMLGISEAFAMIGVTFGIIIVAYLIEQHSWRIIMYAGSIIAAVLAILIMFFLQNKQNRQNHYNNKKKLNLRLIAQQILLVVTNKQVIIASVYAFFIFSIINAFTSLWGVSFLTNTYPMSQPMATSVMSLTFIGIAIGGALNGFLSSKIGKSKIIMLFGAGLATLTMTIIILIPQIPKSVLAILFLLIGVFCSTYIQALSIVKEAVPVNIQGTALAVSNMIIMLGAPILQLLIGGLLDSHFFHLTSQISMVYRLSLSVLPFGMLLAFYSTFFINEAK